MMVSGPKTSPLVEETLAYCASPFAYRRRETHVVMVGDVGVGGDNPIRVQSMTTTRTQDVEATVAQVERLARVGCEIIRITAPTTKDARALGDIKRIVRARGIRAPLVADIHFSPDAALEAANHVEKVRINPGNYADTRKFAVRSYSDAEYAAELQRIEERFAPLVRKCKANGVSMRVGTNHGSLSDRIVNRFGDTPEGMVESALEFLRICEKYGYFDVILSMKASNPKVMIAAYRLLAARMGELGMTYPFHLGVTEAGNGIDGRIKSAIGIGSLLADGIGDTIRVSLTEEPEEEVPVAFALANYFTPRDEEKEAGPNPLAPFPTREGGKEPALTLALSQRERERAQSPLPLGEGQGEGRSFPNTQHPTPNTPLPYDPFHYQRRLSRVVAMGDVVLGGEHPVVVVARAGADATARVLRWASPGNRRLPRPEVVEWPVETPEELEALRETRRRLDAARALPYLLSAGIAPPSLALLASGNDAALLAAALPAVEAVLLREPEAGGVNALAAATVASGKALWLQIQVSDDDAVAGAIERLVAALATARARGQDAVVLGLSANQAELLIHAQRALVTSLAGQGETAPIFLQSTAGGPELIGDALPLGSLLCDGLGDAIQAATTDGGQDEVVATLNILQAAGTRLTKTDYVACPSCGRTLFDLQSTTDRIKAKTAHLAGVKIAIMGCIVNGPGEMADADFGYVGGSPGQVNLYVGKTCVERNVPAEVADEKLIELIKARGRWQEAEEEDGVGVGE